MGQGPRPAGWAPGTGVMIAGWLVGAIIARLTGAPAVVIILVTTLVGAVVEVVAGWHSARQRFDAHVELAPVVTSGEPARAVLTLVPVERSSGRGSRRRHAGRARRVTVRTLRRDVPVDTIAVAESVAANGSPVALSATFTAPGRFDRLELAVEVWGPVGMVCWRRRLQVDIDAVHVAPRASGDLLPVERAATDRVGAVATAAGQRRGDVDGVRPWRRGDGVGAVHWPTSLRADELIVHDRVASSEERWCLDLADAGVEPGRVRHTLEDSLRRGHEVSVRHPDGDEQPVRGPDDAALIAAEVAERRAASGLDGPSGRSNGLAERLRRPLHTTADEPPTLAASARWWTAVASASSIGLLAGALASSAAVLALVVAAVIVGAVVSLRVARGDGLRPWWMRVAIGATIAVALVLIAVDASDVDNLLAALRGPLPNLLMLLVALHCFEVLDRRTARVHQAITLVIAAYAAGLRIDDALGWWLAGWGIAFAAAVVRTGGAVRRPAGRRARRQPVLDWRRPLRIAGRAALVVVATVAALSVVPIPDGPARLGLPALSEGAPSAAVPGSLVGADGTPVTANGGDPARAPGGEVAGYPGFTEALDTSVRGELGDEVVMRVRAPEPAFWRGQTFSDFDGRTWRVDDHVGTEREGPVIDVEATIGDAIGAPIERRQLIQTFYVEQDLPNVVFAAYRPDRVIFDGSLWLRPDGALRSDTTLTRGSVYTVQSQRLQVTEEILRQQGDLGAFYDGFRQTVTGSVVSPFLQLPESTTQRTIDLAESLRVPGEATYDTIERYQAWIADHVEYDLDAPVPADGTDAVDDFLFESRRGFCEQIATALTVMLRSQGVPARLATGYVAGERDRVSGVWEVRASDAHAWVEVWFPQTGWEAFDPTASVPLAGEADSGTVGGDLLAAAVASLGSHRLELAAAVVVGLTGWTLAGLWRWRRQRMRRGRWGLLQDRFGEIAAVPVTATNPQRAAAFPADVAGEARAVADVLDRAAFDPSWVDDDDTYARARSAVATLESAGRSS